MHTQQGGAGPSWLDGAGLLLEDFMTIVAKQCATKRCCTVRVKVYCFVSSEYQLVMLLLRALLLAALLWPPLLLLVVLSQPHRLADLLPTE